MRLARADAPARAPSRERRRCGVEHAASSSTWIIHASRVVVASLGGFAPALFALGSSTSRTAVHAARCRGRQAPAGRAALPSKFGFRPAVVDAKIESEPLIIISERADLCVVLKAQVVPPAGQLESARHDRVVPKSLVLQPGERHSLLVPPRVFRLAKLNASQTHLTRPPGRSDLSLAGSVVLALCGPGRHHDVGRVCAGGRWRQPRALRRMLSPSRRSTPPTRFATARKRRPNRNSASRCVKCPVAPRWRTPVRSGAHFAGSLATPSACRALVETPRDLD